MVETLSPERYVVHCEDDKVRHAEPFATFDDAVRWAYWGHCCIAHHAVVIVPATFETGA